MLTIVIVYLWASISIYLITGGADFGAGMIELLSEKRNSKKITEMMHRSTAPIWEANHMWLILAIVITFVGFPDLYANISSSMFIPITIMLMGIIARGTSYSFRNGDKVKDELKKLDKVIYIVSSIITPFFIGVIGACIYSGKTVLASGSFSERYVYNWMGLFPLSIGLLTVVVCAYLASLYVMGNKNYGNDRFMIKSQAFMLTLSIPFILMLANIGAIGDGFDLLKNLIGIQGILVAIIIIGMTIAIWIIINSEETKWLRLFAAAQVILIQLVLFNDFHRGILHSLIKKGDQGTILSSGLTIHVLAITLMAATLLIIPALGYLIYTFEWQENIYKNGNTENETRISKD